MNIEKLDQTSNLSFRYLDGILSLSNYQSSDYLHRIYSNELKV
jgi:hypothetical protein